MLQACTALLKDSMAQHSPANLTNRTANPKPKLHLLLLRGLLRLS